MPRQIKDEYEIVGEIGSGGMATVHKAVQKSLNRPVAIKELKKSFHADAQIVKRFERESMIAASLLHENIVHIYDYFKKPNYCIVMEYVDGVNLATVIDKAGALPVDIAVMIAVQVSSALDYAHMRGLIHRDIKPSNIMIKRNGEVKLMDFGIAQTRDLEGLTLPGTLIGTPAYMSPEHILGQTLDIRSDIFSFGIVLYEMLTGMKPFTDEDTRAVSAKIVKDKFIRPRAINSEIPGSIQRIIKKCLRKKPHRRFESMLSIEKKLGKRLAGKTTKAASLLRIAEYLVSLNLIEPATEQETLVITGRVPWYGRLMRPAAALLVFFIVAGAAAFYYWRATSRVPSALLSAAPAAPAARSLATHPAATVTPAPAPSPFVMNVSKPSVTAAPPAEGLVSSTTPSPDPPGVFRNAKKKQHSLSVKKTETARKKKRNTESR